MRFHAKRLEVRPSGLPNREQSHSPNQESRRFVKATRDELQRGVASGIKQRKQDSSKREQSHINTDLFALTSRNFFREPPPWLGPTQLKGRTSENTVKITGSSEVRREMSAPGVSFVPASGAVAVESVHDDASEGRGADERTGVQAAISKPTRASRFQAHDGHRAPIAWRGRRDDQRPRSENGANSATLWRRPVIEPWAMSAGLLVDGCVC